ncbi:Uncharacterized [Syntrophomonas zehnderi OL-4]|uniref:Uncharacterized n=1 Tax=Syntrophomonas zehnderi OL-4 TaxID=690567 RepID=A0A0E4C8L3_9FIRM|nr:acyl-CoA dehydratase activase-related protein [Syntrophomonas zehnderi]CFX51831.1 Uncharacterized [Syntrophomonas zehnderi OL-4]
MTRVGIPAGLFYHYYYPLWKTFFVDLGAEVISSSLTNRQTVEKGIAVALDEACFPIKVYFGHIQELNELGPDYLFLPRLVSVEARSYICPKFMGLPDMIKASLPDLPPIIDMVVDMSINSKGLEQEIKRVGNIFTTNEKAISQAFRHGREELCKYRQLMQTGFSSSEAIEIWEGQERLLTTSADLQLGVLGHGYSLYDRCISMNLIGHLREMGCRVKLVETCSQDEIEKAAASLPKRVFWTLGRKNVGAALHMASDDEIDGLVYLACFGCGPDSMIKEFIERRSNGKPFLGITIDEHTGEAGLLTRLEAFCDMLRRRRKIDFESNLPPYGQYACGSENSL